MCWAPDPAQPNKYGTTERLPSKNLRAKTVPPLIDGIEYLTPPPMPFEPAVKRREELFEKEQKEIIEQEKVPNSKETQNEKVVADLRKAKKARKIEHIEMAEKFLANLTAKLDVAAADLKAKKEKLILAQEAKENAKAQAAEYKEGGKEAKAEEKAADEGKAKEAKAKEAAAK